MENNNQNPFQQSAPEAAPQQAPAPVVPAPERKGGVLKGIFIGIGIVIVLAILVLVGFFLFIKFVTGPIVTKSLDEASLVASSAAVKSNLASMRAQAEIVYDQSNFSYSGVCQDASIIAGLNTAKAKAYQGEVACFSDAQEYAIGASIQRPEGVRTVCVNHTGIFATDLEGPVANWVTSAKAACK